MVSRDLLNYKVKHQVICQKPYLMAYQHYVPNKLVGDAVVVFIHGGGHNSKVWEITPDGRKGWAPIFAEKGREVITLDWACGVPAIYTCSTKELCALTQKENIALIKKVIIEEISPRRKIVFLGWSMGGPQAFIMATDILPERTAAILGYALSGPLNYLKVAAEENKPAPLNLKRPIIIPISWVRSQCQMPLFPKGCQRKYSREYLIPFSPHMMAIQIKSPQVKSDWGILTVKNPGKIPPTLLVNGSFDSGHIPAKEKPLKDWLRKFQKDVTVKYIKGFSHLGMLSYGNEKIAQIYLNWLRKRSL